MPTPRHDDHQLHDGVHYPVDHLIGVLRDGDEAEQAAQSLYAAGYTDIEVLEGSAALQDLASMERAANSLARASARLARYLSDQDDARQAVLEALGQGRALVMVQAPGRAQQERAESILRAHGARDMTYFGRWTITDLPR